MNRVPWWCKATPMASESLSSPHPGHATTIMLVVFCSLIHLR